MACILCVCGISRSCGPAGATPPPERAVHIGAGPTQGPVCCVSMHTYTHTSRFVRTHQTYIQCFYIRLQALQTYTQPIAYTRTHTHKCTHAHKRVHTHSRTYSHTHTHAQTQTHAHTARLSRVVLGRRPPQAVGLSINVCQCVEVRANLHVLI